MEQKIKKSGLAIASLVVGLLSLIPGLSILGVIAIVLGIIGLIKIKKNKLEGRGMAITGIVLGTIAIILGFLIYYATSNILNGFLNNTGAVGELKPGATEQVLVGNMGVLEIYKKQNDKYPQDLNQAVDEGFQVFLLDLYLNPLFYEASEDGQSYEMRSLGVDGVYGTEDDVFPEGKFN